MANAREIDFSIVGKAKDRVKSLKFMLTHDKLWLFVSINILLYWLFVGLGIFRLFGLI